MKKLFMGMAAVVLLSSAAFAGTGTNAPKAKLEATESKSGLKGVEEVKETTERGFTTCTYTLKVYENGVLTGSYRNEYRVWSNWMGAGSEYQSCGAWIRSQRAYYSQFFTIY